ncbi:MAG: class I SAM-dependent methyltransferase [Thermoplasmata archaeon]|nr:class I SAM-dependent methyltransferase [Thermoplasmata archaeon]
MQEEPIGNEKLIETMKKMASENGLSEYELNEFLQEYAFEFGGLKLLRNLVGADFDLEVVKNSYEYMRKRRPLSDILAEPFRKGERILSIGCGSGAADVNLAQDGCQVWGMDTNKSGVKIANRLAEEVGLSEDCRFMEVSGYEYPFDDGFFDVVLYSHSLHEIDDKEASLKESHRVLKPEGRVIVLEDGNAREEVVESIENSEFTVRGEHTMPLGDIYGHGSVTSIVAVTLEKSKS